MRNKIAIVIALLLIPAVFGQPSINIVGTTARIEEKNLLIEIIALNTGQTDEKLKITTRFLEQADERNEIVPGNSTKKFTYTLHNIQSGQVTMKIEGGRIKKFVEIEIPDNLSNQELRVREVTEQDYLLPKPDAQAQLDPLIIGVVIAGLVIVGVFAKLFFFRSRQEKQLEANAELLKEADSAKKEKKQIKKIRMD